MVEERVDHIEHKMGEFAATINYLVDANDGNEEEMESMRAKIADMEDRSRRNNMKIRGIPESVQQGDLRTYATSLFTEILPELSTLDIIIDRIHRLPKPSYLPEQTPRDVILRLHFYHAKEQLITAVRTRDRIPPQYQTLQFYADLSQYTLKKRKGLITITKALRNHGITYRWGYPTKLTITKDGDVRTVDTLERGLALLKEWKIISDFDSNLIRKVPSVEPDWQVITAKNSKKHA